MSLNPEQILIYTTFQMTRISRELAGEQTPDTMLKYSLNAPRRRREDNQLCIKGSDSGLLSMLIAGCSLVERLRYHRLRSSSKNLSKLADLTGASQN
jgi:hypothetical protein